MDREASSAKTERKKRETAERASKQAVEDKASVVSTLAEHGQQVAQLQAAARRQERLADERLLRAERHDCSNAFISMLYRLGLGPGGAVCIFCGTRSCAVWYYVIMRYAAVTALTRKCDLEGSMVCITYSTVLRTRNNLNACCTPSIGISHSLLPFLTLKTQSS